MRRSRLAIIAYGIAHNISTKARPVCTHQPCDVYIQCGLVGSIWWIRARLLKVHRTPDLRCPDYNHTELTKLHIRHSNTHCCSIAQCCAPCARLLFGLFAPFFSARLSVAVNPLSSFRWHRFAIRMISRANSHSSQLERNRIEYGWVTRHGHGYKCSIMQPD